MAHPKKKRRRRKRRIHWKALFACAGTIAALVGVAYLVLILFQTKAIYVRGTVYTTKQEVQQWIQSDAYSSNTLYIMWKYNKEDAKLPPAIEDTQVKLKSPWEVTVQVKEKTFSGRVDLDGQFLYFDEKGIASLQYPEVIEGVPYIEGMTFDPKKVKLGEMLPVKNKEVFEKLNSISQLLKKKEVTPDKIGCEDGSIILYFGGVRAHMGMSDYEEKLNHAIPILAKLQELYPDQPGVLRLENYSSSDSSIRFVPDPPAEPAPEG